MVPNQARRDEPNAIALSTVSVATENIVVSGPGAFAAVNANKQPCAYLDRSGSHGLDRSARKNNRTIEDNRARIGFVAGGRLKLEDAAHVLAGSDEES